MNELHEDFKIKIKTSKLINRIMHVDRTKQSRAIVQMYFQD